MTPSSSFGRLRAAVRWWHARSSATRQRLVLATLGVASLAARDVLLFAFAGLLLLVTEATRPARTPASPA